jgi:predicted transcriptional regulator
MSELTPETKKMRALSLYRGLQENGGSQTKLAKKLGITRQAVSQQIKEPYIKSVMSQLLDKAGVNDKFIATKIKEGCEAKKLVYVENGDAEHGEKAREYDDDYATRHRYIETALKVKGHLVAEVSPTNQNHLHLHLESNREDTGERIRDFTNQLSQNNRG